MHKLPVSVHVLTWNSAQTLERTLKSVHGCAEVLIIDGGSKDQTMEIAKRHHAKILLQPAEGAAKDFSAARNVGLRNAEQPWILALDSDELMTPQAMNEIERIVTHSESPAAYFVPRRYELPDGSIVAHASTYPNERIYFFHRDAVTQWQKPVHENVLVKPGTHIGHLQNGSLAPLPPLSVFRSKLNQYIGIEAERSRGKGWMHWIVRRVLHTLRSRVIATIKLLWIWLLPHKGKRLPFAYERARYWYAWRLIVKTCPLQTP